MSQQQKRKHTTLTLKKLEILNKIENSEKLVNLANKFGVGRAATIYEIKK